MSICCINGNTVSPIAASDPCVANARVGATFVGTTGKIYILTGQNPANSEHWTLLELDAPNSINDLDDVNTILNPPNINDVLMWDGTNWVPSEIVIPEFIASEIIADTTNWNNLLSTSAANVQAALNLLDDHVHDDRYSLLGHIHTFGDISGTLPVNRGGTGATTAANARINLGLGPTDDVEFANLNVTDTLTIGGIVFNPGSGGMTAHALSGAFHTGTLDWDLVNKTTSTLADLETRNHSDLQNIGANDHHNQVHTLDGTDHTGTLSWSKVNKTGSNLADIETRNHSSLQGITANDHHNQIHNIVGSDHTVTGAQYSVIGLSALNTLAVIPTSDNGAVANTILRSSSSGTIRLLKLYSPEITTISEDLLLNPFGEIVIPNAKGIRSATFGSSTPIEGWQIDETNIVGQSELTIGKILADELAVRIFVADETRVDRGDEYWAKSYGIVAESFITPSALESTVSVKFEDSPAIAGAIFSDNDWILIRSLDIDTGIELFNIWCQVNTYNDNGDGTQNWTVTLKSGPLSREIAKGQTVIDFGQANQAIIHLSTVDATGSPYIKMRRWSGADPISPSNYTDYVVIGDLDAIANSYYSPSGDGLYIRSNEDQFIVADSNGLQIRGAGIKLYDGINQTVNISNTGNDIWVGTSDIDKHLEWDGAQLSIKGQIVVQAGSTGYSNILDIPTSLSDINSTEGTKLTGIESGATVGATWNSNLYNIPNRFGDAPSVAGLYLTANYLGYYDGALWQAWIKNDGDFYFGGDASNYISWNGSDLAIVGQITIQSGSSGYTNITDKPTSLGDINTLENNKLTGIEAGATVGATWGTNLYSVPNRFGDAPNVAGLYLTATHLGYYTGSAWKTWIQSNGEFYFGGDATNYINWDGSDLTVVGQITIQSGSSGYNNITDTPNSLSDINSTEGTKLSGIESGATVGAIWGTNLSAIPPRFGDAPSVAGLYLTPDYLGYYNGSAWTAWIADDGQFYFGASTSAYLKWDNSAFNLIGANIKLYNGANQTVDISNVDGSIKLGTNISNAATTNFDFNGTTGDILLKGSLEAANGSVLINDDGISVETAIDSLSDSAAYKFFNGISDAGGIYSHTSPDLIDGGNDYNTIVIAPSNYSGLKPEISLSTTNANGKAIISLTAINSSLSTDPAFIRLTSAYSSNVSKIDITANTVTLFGKLIPSTNIAFDLGSSSLRWSNLYTNNVITNDLSFTTVNNASASSGQTLVWDGLAWTVAYIAASGGNDTLYLHNDLSGVSTYESLLITPSASGVEDVDTVAVTSVSGEVLLDAYASVELNTTLLKGGNWDFSTWLSKSNVTGTTSYRVRIYKRTSGGTETELFNFTQPITNTTLSKYVYTYVAGDFSVNTTDRLVVKYYAYTTSVPSINVSLYYEGTTHYSSFIVPFSLRSTAYQPIDAGLTAIADLATTDGNIIVGNGSTWVTESGATARTSLGLGTSNSPTFAGLTINGNIAVSGTVDSVDISAFKSAYDSHTHAWTAITGKPTTFAYTDANNVFSAVQTIVQGTQSYGSGTSIRRLDSSQRWEFVTDATSNSLWSLGKNTVIGTYEADVFLLMTNATQALRIASNQHVQIGPTTADSAQLSVVPSGTGIDGIDVNAPNGSTADLLSLRRDGVDKFIVNQSGYVSLYNYIERPNGYFDIRTADANYGLVLRRSDGTTTSDYLSIWVDDNWAGLRVNASPSMTPAIFITDANNVGIGKTPGDDRLAILYEPTNDSSAYGVTVEYNPAQTVSGAYYQIGIWEQSRVGLGSGISGTGYYRGIATSVLTEDHSGTISDLMGYFAQVGTYTNTTGVVDDVFGMQIQMYRGGAGTINRSIGVYIQTGSAGTTIGDDYGIYVESPAMKNYFAGNVGIGLTNPSAKLHVNGDAIVDGTLNADAARIDGATSIYQGAFKIFGYDPAQFPTLVIDNNNPLFYADVTKMSIGINRDPDEQFDLDVAGAFRAKWIVGPHAIQLSDAALIAHFDGDMRNPSNDFTGTATDVVSGTVPTVTGGVIYRPGKFGKAIQVAEATTNYISVPSFENGAISDGVATSNGVGAFVTGWSVYNTPTVFTSSDAVYGTASLGMTTGSIASPYIYRSSIPTTLTTGDYWTFSAYVKAGNESGIGRQVTIYLRENGDNGLRSSQSVVLSTEWQLVKVTRQLTATTFTSLNWYISFSSVANSGDTVLIDAIQLEQKAYATPYCLHPDSMVMSTNGIVKLDTVNIGDRLVGSNGSNVVEAKWDVYTESYEITLKNGYKIIASGDHRFMATKWPWDYNESSGWKFRTVNELQLNDYVKLSTIENIESGADEPEFAYLLGYLVGDGYFCSADSKNKPRIGWTFGRDYKYLADNVQKLYTACMPKSPNNGVNEYPNVSACSDNEWTLTTQNKQAAQVLLEHGMKPDTGAKGKSIPSCVWNYKKGDLLNFLTGLVDSDGSVDTDGAIKIDSSSETLINEIRLIVSMKLGIHGHVSSFNDTNNFTGNTRTMYRIRFAKADSAYLFNSGLVPYHQIKRSRLALATEAKFRRKEWSQIKSIVALGKQRLIDITLGPNHEFVAEGIVTHNCDGSLGLAPGQDQSDSAGGNVVGGHSWSGTAHASTSSRVAGDVRYSASDNIASSGTIAGWYYSENVGNYSGLWGVYTSGSNRLQLLVANGDLDVYKNTGSGSFLVSGDDCPVGEWFHAAFTWTPTEARLYLNGVQTGTTYSGDAWSGITLSSTNLYIGNEVVDTRKYWNGLVDDLVILSRAASADEIRAIYESNAPVFAESSTSFFKSYANTPVEINAEGLFVEGNTLGEIFAIVGINTGKDWGGFTGVNKLGEGDVLIGNNTDGYLHWDASESLLDIKAKVNIAGDSIISGSLTTNSGQIVLDDTGIHFDMDDSNAVIEFVSGTTVVGRIRGVTEFSTQRNMYIDILPTDNGTGGILYIRGHNAAGVLQGSVYITEQGVLGTTGGISTSAQVSTGNLLPSGYLKMQGNGPGNYFTLNRLTTTQRNALSGHLSGTVIYNTTDNKAQVWTGSAWVNLH